MKNYEFRKLESEDLFLMMQIIKKIGIKEFQSIISRESVQKAVLHFFQKRKDAKGDEANSPDTEDEENDYIVIGQAAADVALEVADIICVNFPNAKKEIYQMLANVSGLSVDNIRHLELPEFAEMIVNFVKKPEFGDFFKVVSKLVLK